MLRRVATTFPSSSVSSSSMMCLGGGGGALSCSTTTTTTTMFSPSGLNSRRSPLQYQIRTVTATEYLEATPSPVSAKKRRSSIASLRKQLASLRRSRMEASDAVAEMGVGPFPDNGDLHSELPITSQSSHPPEQIQESEEISTLEMRPTLARGNGEDDTPAIGQHDDVKPESKSSNKRNGKKRKMRKKKNSEKEEETKEDAAAAMLKSRIKKRILQRRRQRLRRQKEEAEGGGNGMIEEEVVLPADSLLEYSIAHCITSKKDARAMLQFTHKLLKCNLLSLAAPIAMSVQDGGGGGFSTTLKDTSADPEYENDPSVKLQRAYERYQRSRGGGGDSSGGTMASSSSTTAAGEDVGGGGATTSPLIPAPWDPFDVKPQVFALNTYIALPVFTSLPYLRHFCDKFGFSVRDPSGRLWADGSASSSSSSPKSPDEATRLLMRSIIQLSETGGSGGGSGGGDFPNPSNTSAVADEDKDVGGGGRVAAAVSGGEEAVGSAEALADLLTMDEEEDANEAAAATFSSSPKTETAASQNNTSTSSTAHRSSNPPRPSKSERRKQKREQRRVEARRQAKESEARQKDLWASLEAHTTFQISQAAPINTYNVPLARPYFIGYFADIKTLLHNCKGVVPMRVDIVVNPASPLEMVLNRSATDHVLSGENLIQQAYHRVERSIQSELHIFFAVHCPEVVSARSICYPQPSPDGSNPEDVIYDTIVLIDTLGNPAAAASKDTAPMLREMQAHVDRDAAAAGNGNGSSDGPPPINLSFERVMQRVVSGKHGGALLGHYSLSIIPFEAGDVFLQDGSSLFYLKNTYTERRQQQSNSPPTPGGVAATSMGVGKWSAGVRGVSNLSGSPPPSSSSASHEQTDGAHGNNTPSNRNNKGVMVRKGRSVVSSRSTTSQAHRDTIYINDPTMSHTEAHSITSQMFRTGQGAVS